MGVKSQNNNEFEDKSKKKGWGLNKEMASTKSDGFLGIEGAI